MVVSTSDISVILNWTAPAEDGRGTTIDYEIGINRTEADCMMFGSVGDLTDCGAERVRC